MSAERSEEGAPRADRSRLRVLFVVDGLAYNRAVCLAAGLAPWLRSTGAEAELFALFPVDPRRQVPVDPTVRVTHGGSGRVRARWAFPRALARLHRAVRRANVVVGVSEVGPGLLVASLAARIARRPFVSMVHADLPRAVAQWTPFPVLAGAAAFVLPSRREGLPLTLLQALALGVPVIASRCGTGVEGALEDGRCGALVELGSVSALADAIRRHLEDPDDLRRRAAEAAQRADGYDLGRTAAGLTEILQPLRRSGAGTVTVAPAATND